MTKPFIILHVIKDLNGRVVDLKALDTELRPDRHGDGFVQLPDGSAVVMKNGEVDSAFASDEFVIAPVHGLSDAVG